MIEPTTALAFSVFENKGVYALLLGSGISRAAQIPTGWEIVLDLCRRLAALEGVTDHPDWAEWYHEKYGEQANYSRLLDAIAKSPSERRAILHSYIEPTQDDIENGRKRPTRAHHAIAKLVREGHIRVVVTTNFDRLLESALREEGVEPTVIRSEDDLKGATPLAHTRCFILKVHGDYLDTRIKNTGDELETYSKPMNAVLDRIFDEYGLLVCGWSGEWDGALRSAISRASSRRYQTYWASRSEPRDLSRDLISAKAASVIRIQDAESFLETLQQQVEILGTISRPNPISTELLLASVKKYLSSDDHRIQLEDLVAVEARKIKQKLEGPSLQVAGGWSQPEWRRRVQEIEVTTERLARTFLAMARWGRGSDLAIAAEILKELGRKEYVGGLTAYIYLRQYPAVLLFYAFGLGLYRAERFKDLHAWFNVAIDREQRGAPTAAIDCLFLWNWEGAEDSTWQNVEGLERRFAPLSDHLMAVFGLLAKDHFLTNEYFERWFESFELSGTLRATTSEMTPEDLMASHSRPDGVIRAAIGRAGWRHTQRETILAEWKTPEFFEKLRGAGFGFGNRQHLEAAIANISRLAGRLSWR